MRILAPELLGIAFFVIAGWAALWPVRERLGAINYHLAALPTGLLAAPLAACVSTVTGRPLDMMSAAGGALLLVVALWGVQTLALGGGPDRPVTPVAEPTARPVDARSFLIAGGALAVLATVFGLLRVTVATADSYVAYWPLGVLLGRTGELTARVIASRGLLIPSMNAIFSTLGSDWAYVIYPMLGTTLVTWLATTLWTRPLLGASRRIKLFVAGGAALFLVLEPSFIYHSVFVHSHMASAIFLLMALTSMWMAAPPRVVRGEAEIEPAFLMLAGVFTAGLAMSRPDGPAYQFVPVAVAISVLTLSKVRWRTVAAYFAPLLFLVVSANAAAFAQLGVWQSTKLSGRTTLVILGVLAFAAVGPWIVELLDRVSPVRLSGERFLSVLVSVSAALMLVVFALKWETVRFALAHARINLFQGAGGYSYLWYGRGRGPRALDADPGRAAHRLVDALAVPGDRALRRRRRPHPRHGAPGTSRSGRQPEPHRVSGGAAGRLVRGRRGRADSRAIRSCRGARAGHGRRDTSRQLQPPSRPSTYSLDFSPP